ncbi:MAG: hypothetical protein NTY19_36845 [Planctomycetota bacterium]|nr:hypothetical protein [Planctomycetota bacterium]
MAVAVWSRRDADESELLEVWHVHKQRCLPIADERLGGREKTGWDELTNHLLFLTHNCGFTAKDFAAEAEASDKFGDFSLE